MGIRSIAQSETVKSAGKGTFYSVVGGAITLITLWVNIVDKQREEIHNLTEKNNAAYELIAEKDNYIRNFLTGLVSALANDDVNSFARSAINNWNTYNLDAQKKQKKLSPTPTPRPYLKNPLDDLLPVPLEDLDLPEISEPTNPEQVIENKINKEN